VFHKVNHEKSIIWGLPIKQIESGSCHYAVLCENGKTYASGSNNFGQLGSRDVASDYRPLLPCDYFEEPVFINQILCDGFHTRYIDGKNVVFMFFIVM
jgi:alpha-tubulin suppressor-like RCC1 family protein